MFESHTLLLAAGMFLGAALYTSVGHAGASAYIALMALSGVGPAVMRPTALALNILVAGFTSFRYLRVGLFRWRTLWPFLIGALPFALIGGAVQLPGQSYRPLVGVILIIAGIRFLWPQELTTKQDPRDLPIIAGIAFGALVGLLSGLAGTVKALPADLPIYAAAVMLGAIVGTTFGIRFTAPMILRALGAVLIIAGCKLIGVY
jgi:uncharacterized membrane protein YfcA